VSGLCHFGYAKTDKNERRYFIEQIYVIVRALFVVCMAAIAVKSRGQAGFGAGQQKNELLEHEKYKLKLSFVEKN